APLRNMQGLAQALLEDYGDRLDETGRVYAQRLTLAAARMDALIRDLLDYSRLSRAELLAQPLALADVMAEAAAGLADDIRERQAELLVEGTLPRVLAHSTTLLQVVRRAAGVTLPAAQQQTAA